MEQLKNQILYLWIRKTKYDCFEKQGFNFSPLFNFEYNDDDKSLVCKRLENSINVFDSKNGAIANLTAIVGNNGVGKTTLLKYLLNLPDFLQHYSISFSKNDIEACKKIKEVNKNREFIAICFYNQKLNVYNFTNKSILFTSEDFGNMVCEPSKSNVFSRDFTYAYLSIESKTKSELVKKEHNNIVPITPHQLKIQNYQYLKSKYYELIGFQLNYDDFSFEDFLTVLFYSNFNVPEITNANVGIRIKSFGEIFIKKKTENNPFSTAPNLLLSYGASDLFDQGSANRIAKEKGLCHLLLWNLNKELQNAQFVRDGGLCYEWDINHLEPIEELIKERKDKSLNAYKYFTNALKEIDLFYESYQKQESSLNFDLDDTNTFFIKAKHLKKILNHLVKTKEKSFLLKYLVFDLQKSDGELAYLRHLTYLYYLSKYDLFSKNIDKKERNNYLIMMDEVDIHLHPEWQRKLISNSIKLINTFFSNKNVQIVLTTHSPLVLSDVPSNNIIYISKNDDLSKKVQKRLDIQTFGSNIFDLYNDSFYFNGNVLIGDFAKSFIDNLYEDITKHKIENKNEIINKINIIGEKVIKRKLFMVVEDQNTSVNSITDIKDIIEVLNRKKEEIDKIIESLKDEKKI